MSDRAARDELARKLIVAHGNRLLAQWAIDEVAFPHCAWCRAEVISDADTEVLCERCRLCAEKGCERAATKSVPPYGLIVHTTGWCDWHGPNPCVVDGCSRWSTGTGRRVCPDHNRCAFGWLGLGECGASVSDRMWCWRHERNIIERGDPSNEPPPIPASIKPCYLYRYFDADGALLYVGISVKPSSRDKQHRQVATWYSQVASYRWERCANESEARRLESEAIRREHPVYNVVGRRSAEEAA